MELGEGEEENYTPLEMKVYTNRKGFCILPMNQSSYSPLHK